MDGYSCSGDIEELQCLGSRQDKQRLTRGVSRGAEPYIEVNVRSRPATAERARARRDQGAPGALCGQPP